MPTDTPRSYDLDDDDEFCIRKRDTGNGKTLMWLAVAAVCLALIAGVTGVVILVLRSESANATAAKLPGSWRGRFEFGGKVIDAVYVFEKGGNFRQEDPHGALQAATGRWRVAQGEIIINWDDGQIERATVTWTDDRNMVYTIVDHDERIQIGSVTKFCRLPPAPGRK
jgi:hypothetical protein